MKPERIWRGENRRRELQVGKEETKERFKRTRRERIGREECGVKEK